MEEDIQSPIKTTKLNKRIKDAISTAEEHLNYENAHNETILNGLDIVRKFIKDKKRVCYGGTAMNMILPEALQFYDTNVDLPDYDFFTPDMNKDVKDLVKILKDAGFDSVFHKVGIHDGTTKVLINFTAVADVTNISESVYKIIKKRAYVVDKIHYTDPDILRMMMYLELSRPRGMVSRWEKVYDRLRLINECFPPMHTKTTTRKAVKSSLLKKIDKNIYDEIINYCIDNERVLFIGPFEQFYREIISGKTQMLNMETFKDVIGIFSSDVERESDKLLKYIDSSKCTKHFQAGDGDIIPECVEIRCGSTPIILIFKEYSCNSYISFNTSDSRIIHIASLDTMITTLYTISIYMKKIKNMIHGLDKIIPKLITHVETNRLMKKPLIPAFPLTCKGYQKGFPTLLKEKMLRKKLIDEKYV